jgi:hypothetical protein
VTATPLKQSKFTTIEAAQRIYFSGKGILALLEPSQKTAKLYQTRSVKQKRIIMSELFHSISTHGDVVSVTLTKPTQVIA